MNIYDSKNLFYSTKASYICNFLSGFTALYVLIFWLPYGNIRNYIYPLGLIMLFIPFFVGIIPALVYNLIRFYLVKSGELNYGMLRYIISTVVPFMTPMLIYYIAWCGGFRINW